MARRLAAACLGALLSGARAVWEDGTEVDEEAARLKSVRLGKHMEKSAQRLSEHTVRNDTCFKEHAGYVPLNMKGANFTITESPELCQVRCNQTDGCERWTYYHHLKHCHITDENALLSVGIVGFTSGPKVCRIQNCTTDMSSYWPWLEPAGFYHGISKLEAMKRCQKLCVSVADCAHFILKIPSLDCHLADKHALKSRMYGSLTGPPTCTGRKEIEACVTLDEEPADSKGPRIIPRSGARLGGHAALAGALAGAAALATFGLAAVRCRRRGRSSSSLGHECRGLELQLSADAVEEGEEQICLQAEPRAARGTDEVAV